MHGEAEDFVNVLVAITHIEDGALEARAAALLADQFDVGEELHLHGDGAIALASFTAAAGDIEGEMAGAETAALGVRSGGEEFADGIEGLQISCGIGAWGA